MCISVYVRGGIALEVVHDLFVFVEAGSVNKRECSSYQGDCFTSNTLSHLSIPFAPPRHITLYALFV